MSKYADYGFSDEDRWQAGLIADDDDEGETPRWGWYIALIVAALAVAAVLCANGL